MGICGNLEVVPNLCICWHVLEIYLFALSFSRPPSYFVDLTTAAIRFTTGVHHFASHAQELVIVLRVLLPLS